MRKVVIILLCVGVVLVAGLAAYVFIYHPRYVAPQLEYDAAVAEYQSGNYVSAAIRFEAMNGFGNSAEYASSAWIAAGDASFAEGDLAQARVYYGHGNADADTLAGIDAAYFELGSKAYSDDEYLQGELYFESITDSARFGTQMDAVRIAYAAQFIKINDYSTAVQIFNYCTDESKQTISDTWLSYGTTELRIWNIDNAAACFTYALDKASDRDATYAKIDFLWTDAGAMAAQAGDYTLAQRCYLYSSNAFDADAAQQQASYEQAMGLYSAGDYFEALPLFVALGDYSDSQTLAAEIQSYLKRWLVAGGSVFYATLDFDGAVQIHGDWEDYTAPDWSGIASLAVGKYRFMLGLRSDGTVVGNGNGTWGNLDVSSWTNIVQVSCGDMHSVGLRSNGTVLAVGRNIYGQRNVEDWSDIIQVACGISFTVGLKSDGTVVACGQNSNNQCNVDFMTDVVQIAVGGSHTVALRSDGTVIACGSNNSGQCNVGTWTDIVEIYAGVNHTVGLKSDGTLVACGSNSQGEIKISSYQNVLCCSCGASFTLIMLDDGTIIKLGAIINVE